MCSRYAAAATSVSHSQGCDCGDAGCAQGTSSCCGPAAEAFDQDGQVFGAGLYAGSDTGGLPQEAVLASLAKTNRLVVVEEGFPVCSVSSEIMAICMEEGFDDLDAPVLRVTNEDVPMPYAANLEKLALIDTARIVKAVKKVCYKG